MKKRNIKKEKSNFQMKREQEEDIHDGWLPVGSLSSAMSLLFSFGLVCQNMYRLACRDKFQPSNI